MLIYMYDIMCIGLSQESWTFDVSVMLGSRG